MMGLTMAHKCTSDCQEFDKNGARIDIHICPTCGELMDYYRNRDGSIDIESGFFCTKCDHEADD